MKRSVAAPVLGLALVLGFGRALYADEPEATQPSASAASPREERLERRLERLRERAAALASALPLTSAPPLPSGSAAPPDLAAAQELAKRWSERLATRLARREEHRAELRRELGERTPDPAVVAELKLHAQRVADLARVEFLAKNARSGAERTRLLARVGKLLQRETARHHARMTGLLAPLTAPSAVPAPSASGAAP